MALSKLYLLFGCKICQLFLPLHFYFVYGKKESESKTSYRGISQNPPVFHKRSYPFHCRINNCNDCVVFRTVDDFLFLHRRRRPKQSRGAFHFPRWNYTGHSKLGRHQGSSSELCADERMVWNSNLFPDYLSFYGQLPVDARQIFSPDKKLYFVLGRHHLVFGCSFFFCE